jgi:site-specific DNA recombinase
MKAAVYARVSTERQAERGTIGSQIEALRAHVTAAGDEITAEYRDDGHSGARLDRPGLDALRDAAEAGLSEVIWCLSPDRLARSYAYQVLILDELARFGVAVRFSDAPALDDQDPQARLLTQVQGVIAEYERAKIGERYRRGKLYRSRAGEVISRKAPYGYRRIPRGPGGPARLEIYEPEAAVVRRIFADRAAGTTIRQICRQLNADAIPTPTGSRATWGTSTLGRILANEAYIGRVYYNRTETVPDPRPGHRTRQVPRPRSDWIAIPCPAIITDEAFQAAAKASTDNAQWSPRRAEPGAWLLRGLVNAGPAASAPTATRCAAATAPGTATTTATTTTRCAPEDRTAAAPNATSAPTPSTSSSSPRSAQPSSTPPCSWPANRPSPSPLPSPTTNCSPPNSPGWTASSTPPAPSTTA